MLAAPDVARLLDEMGRRRWTNVLVEGGAAVLGSFCDADLIDEIHVFIGPKLIGGSGKSPVAGEGLARLDQRGSWIMEAGENIEGDAYGRYVRSS